MTNESPAPPRLPLGDRNNATSGGNANAPGSRITAKKVVLRERPARPDFPASPRLSAFDRAHRFSLADNYLGFCGDAKLVIRNEALDGERVIKRLPAGIIVKEGPGVRIDEAYSLSLARTAGLKVPQILGFDEKDGCGYLFMEDVEGEALQYAWPRLSLEQQKRVVDEVVAQLALLRTQTSTTIGTCTGRAPPRLLGKAGNVAFATIADYCDAIEAICPRLRLESGIDGASRAFDETRNSPQPSFRFHHGDVSPRNIIVSPTGTLASIIDWGDAAFLPDGFEYADAILEEHHLRGQPGSRSLLQAVKAASTEVEARRGSLIARWLSVLEEALVAVD
ncbi:hypothetical protein Rhopal_000300-T1 [Rhodotorula paludigena]|uniref:Aminoglycoside phosphotransferase domain-containing protein n=1 Tax=Rhodotorula paludigena TaxID=86838 RepID=A0AAV5G4J8_9BASI|nr:hypothetical protein Rhopal_000300-T1 [Rhodotorula paludigena]